MRLLSATTAALLVVAIFGMSGTAASRPQWFQLTPTYSYEQYQRDFGKRRHDAELRKPLFEAELASVLEHNAAGTALYKRGINEFSDWTPEERARHRHMFPPIAAAPERKLGPQGAPRVPASRLGFDWRDVTPPILTTAKDQGACGSCWAHSTIEAIESQVALATGELFVLSQQQIISCAPPVHGFIAAFNDSYTMGGCNGYLPHWGLNFLIGAPFRGGVTQEWSNPYVDYYTVPFSMPTHPCEPWMSQNVSLSFANVSGYKFLPSNNATAFEEALINDGPVIVIVYVTPSFESYESGIFSSDSCMGLNGTMQPSHAVNLVGFGHDAELKADYWIVRNSWSERWGEAGYIRMLRPKDAEPCGTMYMPTNHWMNATNWEPERACGMCGVLTYGVVPGAH